MEQKVLILGSNGMLGQALMSEFSEVALGFGREDVDVTNTDDLKFKIKNLNPAVIINTVAYNDVDGAEENFAKAFKLNKELVANLADITTSLGIILVHYSTNYVFDGKKGKYKEDDVPKPISVYADSKFQGELQLQKIAKKYYLIRTAVLFGKKGLSNLSKKSFVELMLGLSQKQKALKVVEDEINSLTYTVDLARQTKLLLDKELPFGIYHITNSGQASWYDYAREIFKISKVNVKLNPVPSIEFSRKAKRPKKSVLVNTKLPQLRNWKEALSEFLISNF